MTVAAIQVSRPSTSVPATIPLIVIAVGLPEPGTILRSSAGTRAPTSRSSRSRDVAPGAGPGPRARGSKGRPPYSYATQALRPSTSSSGRFVVYPPSLNALDESRLTEVGAFEQPIHRHPGPHRVELGPFRDAVDVHRDRLRRDRGELLRSPGTWALGQAPDFESPLSELRPWRGAGREHRELSGHDCPGGSRDGSSIWGRRPVNPREMIGTPTSEPARLLESGVEEYAGPGHDGQGQGYPRFRRSRA